MRRTGPAGIALAVAAAAVSLAQPALAHHAMDGGTPRTALEGLLSGLAHPVIGIDHLAFMIGVGLLAGAAGSPARRGLLPLAFVAATLAGTALHLRGIGVPFVELAVGCSILAMALAVFANRRLPAALLAALFAAAGVFHGYAYAESVVGAEPAPLYAYLLGFVAVQYAVAAASALALKVLRNRQWEAPALRFASLALAVVGVTVVMGA